MKRKKKATHTRRQPRPRKSKSKGITLRASAEDTKRSYRSMDDVLNLYRPRKKPITLRLDADVLAWFKRQGRGYQTRINAVLRKLMRDEMKR